METVHSKKFRDKRDRPKAQTSTCIIIECMQFAAKYAKITTCILQADRVFIYTYTVKKLSD